jgi:predicted acyl esterase
MRIDWDVPIEMDGKGLAFQEGYAGMWQVIEAKYPEILRGSSSRYQNWETVDPEKWVPDGYACVRVDSRGAGRSPGYLDPFSGPPAWRRLPRPRRARVAELDIEIWPTSVIVPAGGRLGVTISGRDFQFPGDGSWPQVPPA